MKKLLLLLIIPFLSFGQTKEEAIDFLKTNIYEWACVKTAHGTSFIRKTTISLIQNGEVLEIKVKLPEYSQKNGYYINRIHLSKVIRIETSDVTQNQTCGAVKIITTPNGIETVTTGVNGEIIFGVEKNKAFFMQHGWVDENLRIENNNKFEERSARITRALKFLAEINGAELKKSHF